MLSSGLCASNCSLKIWVCDRSKKTKQSLSLVIV
jgi:hypothetical protein